MPIYRYTGGINDYWCTYKIIIRSDFFIIRYKENSKRSSSNFFGNFWNSLPNLVHPPKILTTYRSITIRCQVKITLICKESFKDNFRKRIILKPYVPSSSPHWEMEPQHDPYISLLEKCWIAASRRGHVKNQWGNPNNPIFCLWTMDIKVGTWPKLCCTKFT